GRGEVDRDLPGDPRGNFVERETDLDRRVSTPPRPAAAEHRAECTAAEEGLEDVADAPEAREARLPATRPQAFVAVSVVDRATLGIAQDLVRLRPHLEFLLGGGVVPVDVGMQLARELAERLLDVGVARLGAHPEELV